MRAIGVTSLLLLCCSSILFVSAQLRGPEPAVFNNAETYGAYTMTQTDTVITFDTTQSNSNSVVLYTCDSNNGGQLVYIIDLGGDASTNNIAITASGTDTLRGQSSLSIATNYGSALLMCDSNGHWVGHFTG